MLGGYWNVRAGNFGYGTLNKRTDILKAFERKIGHCQSSLLYKDMRESRSRMKPSENIREEIKYFQSYF